MRFRITDPKILSVLVCGALRASGINIYKYYVAYKMVADDIATKRKKAS